MPRASHAGHFGRLRKSAIPISAIIPIITIQNGPVPKIAVPTIIIAIKPIIACTGSRLLRISFRDRSADIFDSG